MNHHYDRAIRVAKRGREQIIVVEELMTRFAPATELREVADIVDELM